MTLPPFYSIGSITDDLQPFPHPGGIGYIALAAVRLGHPSHLITKIAPNHPYIKLLEDMGVIIHNVAGKDEKIALPSFHNVYDKKGKRTMHGTRASSQITADSFSHFPSIADNAIIVIAPYLEEVNEDLFPILAKRWKLAMAPQGNYRSIGKDGIVQPKRWEKVSALSFIDVTILSEEDITFPGHTRPDEKLLTEICSSSPIVLVTRGLSGVTLFERNKPARDVKEFPLLDTELKDFTGAGDSFTASFMHYYSQTGDTFAAAAFANLYSALKIAGIAGDGNGFDLVPTDEEMKSFITHHPERFQSFLASNKLEKFII